MSWTILWDMHRHPGKDRWSRAIESNEGEALQRAERFLKLGFVVYEIRDPKGLVVHDEAAIGRRFKPAPGPQSPSEPPLRFPQ
ncbi:MAG TPA: hypothetical protein VJO12_16945 [Stellaceae bacterium]|nr:hypothetical protein [Stellaceae bacterium]